MTRPKTLANQCPRCRTTRIIERVATSKRPYAFGLSGLSNLLLCGIKVQSCAKCGLESPTIPRLGRLMDTIARSLLRKPARLTGEELRYLRKHVGMRTNAFAARVRVRPEHLSRVENGKSAVAEQLDRLARAVVSAELDQEFLRELLLDWVDDLEEAPEAPAPCFELHGKKWVPAA